MPLDRLNKISLYGFLKPMGCSAGEKVLLHVCCGPCMASCLEMLEQEGFCVQGFFYNPNIHPYSEYKKRLEAALEAGDRLDLDLMYHRYDMEEFLRDILNCPTRRQQHELCWRIRLQETAKMAQAEGISLFTTTLLSSPYQDIEEIRRIGEDVASLYNRHFLFRNFRKGFQAGHQLTREWKLYHQNYCGCLLSEKEAVEQRESKQKRCS